MFESECDAKIKNYRNAANTQNALSKSIVQKKVEVSHGVEHPRHFVMIILQVGLIHF